MTNVLRCILAASCLAASFAANAQLFRTYVASTGNDTNPCTIVAPCRLLPAALAAVADSGEVWMLDSANYNVSTVNIAKSVTILAVPGAVGSVVANGQPAIHISGGASIALRNLNVGSIPLSGAATGIVVAFDGRLALEHVVISRMAGGGVRLGGVAQVVMSDIEIRDVGGSAIELSGGAYASITRAVISGVTGRAIDIQSVGAQFAMSHSTIATVDTGVYVGAGGSAGTAKAAVQDSQIFDTREAVLVETTAPSAAIVSLNGNQISSSAFAVTANGAGSIVVIKGNAIVGNANGIRILAGATVESAGDNILRRNTADVSGTIAHPGQV